MTFKSWIYDHFIADKYDGELEEYTQGFRQICADRVGIKEGDVVLDLGCDTPVDAVLATLIFSVVPNWREVFDLSFQTLKPGGRYGVMDNYWPKPTLRLWFGSWSFAANPKRPGFEPLQLHTEDFVLEYHPPDEESQFYVAHGTKDPTP